jgi:tRNA A37 methylthiotransferase MiaB
MIVLFNPRSTRQGREVLPMSVLSLGAVLDGWRDYAIVDGNLCDDPLSRLRRHVAGSDAPVLAVTVMPGRQVREARDACRTLKREYPTLSVVWGGYFPTMYPNACLSAPYVDLLLRGHAEEPFVALIRALENGQTWRNQAGLSWRDPKSGETTHNPIGPVPDINALPPWPYHRLPMEKYVLNTFLGSRTLSHHASYGCPFTCNFCGVTSMVNGRYSAQTPEVLERSVATLVNGYGANAIQFYDNNFFVNEARTVEICERLAKYDIVWWAYGRVDTLMTYRDSTWAAMRDSGLKMMYIGVEAGSDETLANMDKGGRQTADLGIEFAIRMKAYDMVPELSFVIGCPPEPDDDIDRTFRYIRKIKDVNPDAEIIIYPYAPVPVEGALLSGAEESGFAFPETLDEWAQERWIQFAERTTAALPWLSEATQRKIGDFQRVLFAAYPTTTDPALSGLRRRLLMIAGMWRYKSQFYRGTYELRLLNKLMPHKRPEVTGF